MHKSSAMNGEVSGKGARGLMLLLIASPPLCALCGLVIAAAFGYAPF
jgi:hypothetical protein